MLKQLLRFLGSYKFILSFTFLFNVAIFAAIVYFLNVYIYGGIAIIAFVIAVFVLAKSNEEPAYKTMWILVIVILPLFGTILYLLIKGSNVSGRQKKFWRKINADSLKYLVQDKAVLKKIETVQPQIFTQAKYMLQTAGAPVYSNSYAKYLPSGEKFFDDLKEELKKAKHFILMEFFIIKEGRLWQDILEILKQRAAEGVEVKIVYDDFGTIDSFRPGYFKRLSRYNIEAVVFNRLHPTLNQFINYRSHRKIVVIDGLVAYTGGVNIGDEYINLKSKFGHWQDCGIKVYGEAVFPHTVMFFSNYCMAKKIDYIDVSIYKRENLSIKNRLSYIQPFSSGPIDRSPIARNNYVRMLYGARRYIYIQTPYLVIDGTTIKALKMAAKSGVDVRIVLPGTPDKKIVYVLGRSYYKELMEEGVKIYEYTPGFVHGKMVVSDDIMACIGTINFDFRSLFLHFENAVLIYNDPAILDMKQNFNDIFEQSHLVTPEDIKKRKAHEKFFAKILRLFAPLM